MNKGLLLSFTEILMGIVDIIPKVVYFLFTAFSSAIDALQALIRKLAGLDTYYSATTGEAFNQTDPLTEFIYGILGIGNSSATYKALNTVFWSLAVFAVIMLVVTTMIAMIKSHYNEDYAGTNPWKYIYTAIKAVLTFAVIPLVMIFGLKLSSFVLVTLDNITASTATEEQIKEVYGSEATDIFVAGTMKGTDEKSYVHYDIFNFGDPTNNTPMGSMLFRAAAYGCNRARSGNVPYTVFQNVETGSKQIFGSDSSQEFSSLTSAEEKQEYIAYQIDYAFCNHLHLASGISISALDSTFQGEVAYDRFLDIFNVKDNVPSFSKYNVSLVWFFYDLWQFNFIVAFGGGITIFGLLLSIIVGLMSRLIKGAGLFLVYPPLLGIAPLDNFKAFKGWATMMIQQILMSLGAIVGMNIMLLLLPYLQNIAFFGIGIIDWLISLLVLIVGLIMVKDFIGVVSGFAGGADVNNLGSGMKGEVAGTLKKGASITGKIGGSAARVVGGATLKATKGLINGMFVKPFKAANKQKRAKALDKLEAGEMKNLPIRGLQAYVHKAIYKATHGHANDQVSKIAAEAIEAAKKEGKDERAQEAAARQAIHAFAKEQNATDGKSKNYFEQLKEAEYKDLDKGQIKKLKEYNQAVADQDRIALGELDWKKGKDGNYALSDSAYGWKQSLLGRAVNTVAVDGAFKGFLKPVGLGIADGVTKMIPALGKSIVKGIDGISIGKTMANGFVKSLGALGEATGLDKTFAGLKDIFKTTLTMEGGPKFKPAELEGDKLQKDIAARQQAETAKQTAYLKTMADNMVDLKRAQTEGNRIQEQTFQAVSEKKGSDSSST